MITIHKQTKIRQISISTTTGEPCYGITIPKKIAEHNLGIYFVITDREDGTILLTSGGKIEK